MKLHILKLLLILSVMPGFSYSADPQDTLSLKVIYEKLNLSSFRNSTGPARMKGQKYFSDLGLPLSKIDGDTLFVETTDWLYKIKLMEARDINGDGSEDAIICFTDKAKHASYNAQQPILVTRYEATGDIVAIKFEVDGCEEYAK